MAKAFVTFICGYTLLAGYFVYSNGHIESTVDHCCIIGSSTAEVSHHCNDISISTPVKEVPPETQSVCFSAMELCCVSHLRTLQCEEGREVARSGKTCPNDNTDRKLCCEACKLGIISASMSVECNNPKFKFGCLWDSAFEACCGVNDFQKYDKRNLTTPSTSHVSDENICEIYPGELCSQICVPTVGSYTCQCNKGFALMADGKSCQLSTTQNRCEKNNQCQHRCNDNGISVECSCEKGYRLHANQKNCTDIDECVEGLHNCKSFATCRNEPGGFYCEYYSDIDVPAINSGSSKTSVPFGSDTKCQLGYEVDTRTRQCVDVNECAENSHVCQSDIEECVNLQGGYKCIRRTTEHNCNIGFKWNYTSLICVDVNECEDLPGDSVCDSNQVCQNTVGSYSCRCKTGYQLDSLTQACVDINECLVDLHNCLTSQRCDNTIGSYQCVRYTNCGTGYTLNAQTGLCEDDDECLLKIDNCQTHIGPDYVCRNTPGSFRCEKKSKIDCEPGKCSTTKLPNQSCPKGFQMLPNGQCEDVNECERGTATCGSNSRCINVHGGFICSNPLNCDVGFRLNDAKTKCIDINECTEHERICDHSCTNLMGSYMCTCRSGYKLHEDNRTCIDINECELFKDQRLCIGYCVNQPGSYSCQCPQGYVLGTDLSSCQDIDECKDRSVCTGEDEVCLNMRGSYRCNDISCPPGYVKDSVNKNRCKKASLGCRQDDTECIQQPLVYSYYFIALVSNYTILPGGIDLFTMRGPLQLSTNVSFNLKLIIAHTQPGIEKAKEESFLLSPNGHNKASIKLVESLIGPQDIQLQLTMTFYHNGIYGGNTVSKIGLFVSQYEF